MKKAVALCLFGILSTPSMAAPPPTVEGQCSNTFVEEVTSRFGAESGEFGSEDSILSFTNGLGLYLYRKLRSTQGWGITPESNPVSLIEARSMFRPNDKVKVCLQYIPTSCRERQRLGDKRGEIYLINNYRNDATTYGHRGRNSCGGA